MDPLDRDLPGARGRQLPHLFPRREVLRADRPRFLQGPMVVRLRRRRRNKKRKRRRRGNGLDRRHDGLRPVLLRVRHLHGAAGGRLLGPAPGDPRDRGVVVLPGGRHRDVRRVRPLPAEPDPRSELPRLHQRPGPDRGPVHRRLHRRPVPRRDVRDRERRPGRRRRDPGRSVRRRGPPAEDPLLREEHVVERRSQLARSDLEPRAGLHRALQRPELLEVPRQEGHLRTVRDRLPPGLPHPGGDLRDDHGGGVRDLRGRVDGEHPAELLRERRAGDPRTVGHRVVDRLRVSADLERVP
mmetsp:Transcript_17227/g.39810  ORF Transcript_17227/g.39810 Transcript_17227/m.39810 type:complete len:297 (-) Transcript_17227:604-1494(-)